MKRMSWAGVCCALAVAGLAAQSAQIPRPPAQTTPPKPEDGSAAPDGYAPIPAVARSDARAAPGRDGRLRRRDGGRGHLRRVLFRLPARRPHASSASARAASGSSSKDGKVSEPLEGLPANLWAHGQGLFEVRPDRAFATNRTIYLTYTVLPDGANQAALPRSPGVLLVASAKLSADDRGSRTSKVLLNAEGTGGRLIQAPDGTLLITSTIPVRRRHQRRRLAAAAAARQRHGQGAAHQRGRIDPEGQPVRRPRRRASGNLRARHSATRRGSRSIRAPASCGRASTVRAAATRSTRSRKGRTTASR